MSDLIDREKLAKQFECASWYEDDDRDFIAKYLLEEAPAVDAEPVTHCKDCTFHGNCIFEGTYLFSHLPESRKFCGIGKKKERKT